MKDYSDIGLDSNLNSTNSLGAATTDFVDGYSFSEGFEDAQVSASKLGSGVIDSINIGTAAITTAKIADLAVTNAKINDVSFNKAQGGTLVLGGTNNTSGVFSLRDEGGTEKISMDKDGMTVNDGKITINNDDGTAIIDSSGLHSINNFGNAQLDSDTEISTTSESYVNIAGGTLSDLVLDRSRRVLLFLFCYGKQTNFPNATSDFIVDVYDTKLADSTGLQTRHTGEWVVTNIDFGAPSYTWTGAGQTQSNVGIVTAAAGTHAYNIRYKMTGSGGTATIYNWRFGYLLLGE